MNWGRPHERTGFGWSRPVGSGQAWPAALVSSRSSPHYNRWQRPAKAGPYNPHTFFLELDATAVASSGPGRTPQTSVASVFRWMGFGGILANSNIVETVFGGRSPIHNARGRPDSAETGWRGARSGRYRRVRGGCHRRLAARLSDLSPPDGHPASWDDARGNCDAHRRHGAVGRPGHLPWPPGHARRQTQVLVASATRHRSSWRPWQRHVAHTCP